MGLITTKRAAEILGIGPVRVRQLIAGGQLQSEKQGRDHLLDEAEVRRFDREMRRPTGRPRKSTDKKVWRVR
jgi:site-specific DNA-methyltransferase (adenine-specific)